MSLARRTVVAIVLAGGLSAGAAEPSDPDTYGGWQGMRVIEQEGRPDVLCGADLNGDGFDEIILVNTRYSRLDLYQWLPKDSWRVLETADKERPNELPMARDFRHDELQLEHLPRDVAVTDTDGDGHVELIVLVTNPNKVLIHERSGENVWKVKHSFQLLSGELASGHRSMLLRKIVDERVELLIGFTDGVQRLELKVDGRADWLTPRERKGRVDWWIADLNGDGHEDLVERSRDASLAIRWWQCSESGRLMPPQTLHDRALNGAEVLRNVGADQLMLLDGTAKGLLRRYRASRGKPGIIGRRRTIGVAGAHKIVWCGLPLGEAKALVVADPQRPRLLTYILGDAGWESEHAYPALADIRAIAAPVAQPGTLLIWSKDAADLQVSRWENERLTYPKVWTPPNEAEDSAEGASDTSSRKILALRSVGQTLWWAQKVDKDLHIYRWPASETEPVRTVFHGVGAKADEVEWLTGERLLVKNVASRAAQLVVREGEATKVTQPTHLKRVDLGDLKLVPTGQEIRVARLADGVLQWLGEDLHPTDQIMLPQGQELIDYVADDATSGWAIQKDGKYLHRIEVDSNGIAQRTERVKVFGGVTLAKDSVLGLLLVDHNQFTHLDQGDSLELELVDVIDDRIGRTGGVKETSFHRISTTDVNGDGLDEVLLFDDRRHRITALTAVDDKLTPQISWPIFEDNVYPYGGATEELVREPRVVVGLDLDGDEHQDLAIVCHDRLILYLARDTP